MPEAVGSARLDEGEPKLGPPHEPGESDFVVVANRLPIDIEVLPDGTTAWKRSPGGLVTALEPLLRKRRGAWVGWPGSLEAPDGPIDIEDLRLHPVPLDTTDIAEYYEGFSNATLWPLYHDVIVKPEYRREWWNAYVEVNRRFAEATSKAAAEGATVWIQDYQLQLVPAMLREMRPDLRIGIGGTDKEGPVAGIHHLAVRHVDRAGRKPDRHVAAGEADRCIALHRRRISGCLR